MQRPGQMRLNDQRGISQGVGLITVLGVGLAGLSLVYFMARQEVYAESDTINFAKVNQLKNSSNPVSAD